jgi:hypothetical protein
LGSNNIIKDQAEDKNKKIKKRGNEGGEGGGARTCQSRKAVSRFQSDVKKMERRQRSMRIRKGINLTEHPAEGSLGHIPQCQGSSETGEQGRKKQ